MKGSIRIVGGLLLLFTAVGTMETSMILGGIIGLIGAALMYSGSQVVVDDYEESRYR